MSIGGVQFIHNDVSIGGVQLCHNYVSVGGVHFCHKDVSVGGIHFSHNDDCWRCSVLWKWWILEVFSSVTSLWEIWISGTHITMWVWNRYMLVKHLANSSIYHIPEMSYFRYTLWGRHWRLCESAMSERCHLQGLCELLHVHVPSWLHGGCMWD